MGRLQNVVSGKLTKPTNVCIYGGEGVGKTTFGAGAPKPIVLATEDGTNHLNVTRDLVKSWDEANELVDELINDKHDYQSLTVDSLDALERMMHRKLCGTQYDVIQNVSGGYGKGETKAMNTWEPFLQKLNRLRHERNMNLILICHTEIKTFNDPNAIAPYDRIQLKLEKKSAALIREFVDDLLFAHFETFVTKEKNEKKGRALGDDGRRMMFTERRAAFDAKNRNNLPFEMEVSWPEYYRLVTMREDPTKIIAEIQKIVLPEEIQKRMLKAIDDAKGDVTALVKIKNHAMVLASQNVAG